MTNTPSTPTYHVLLIGIDCYPVGYRSLFGCVNDIDAIEQVLLDSAGVGLPADHVCIKRLAAPHPGISGSSRLLAQTLLPTKANIVAALQELTEVAPEDRVLVYYSGHGAYAKWEGAGVWHEALVPSDMQLLYDIEINTLINAIARRVAGDLTLVLDCCHSAGAFRNLRTAIVPGSDRFLERTKGGSNTGEPLNAPPDWSLVQGAANALPGAQANATSLLRITAPNYLVIAACQAVETAREQPLDVGDHGLLSYSLAQLLAPLDAAARAEIRWIDIWSQLLGKVADLSPPGHLQHPVLVGRPERRIFGGSWRPQDPGYPVSQSSRGDYQIAAGSLMGVTAGAEIALYGGDPYEFPIINSVQDLHYRIGLLRVVQADHAGSTAIALPPIHGPVAGAMRGRLAKPGIREGLQIRLDPPEVPLARFLCESPLLRVLLNGGGEVQVKGTAEAGWTIDNEITQKVAWVPPAESDALRAGLMHYAQYNCALRLTQHITALGHQNLLTVDLLDCTNPQILNMVADPHNPDLPYLLSLNRNSYRVAKGTRFCIKVTNNYTDTLYIHVLNCEAFGRVETLGHLTIRAGDHQVLWDGENLHKPWHARPSTPLDDSRRRDGAVDRLVVVGTTRPDVDLKYLELRKSVQEVINAHIGWRGPERSVRDIEPGLAEPAELWTAELILLQIGSAKA